MPLYHQYLRRAAALWPVRRAGTRYARNQVLDEAKRAGANRAVFERVEPGVPALQIRARAYAC